MEIFTILANTVCIPLILSLLAIAFPLLLQTVSRIDDKYHSTRLTEVFYKERISQIFIIALIVSLISILVWLFKKPRIIDIGIFNVFVDNSAAIIISLCTIIIVVSLFYLVSLIKAYYNPMKLLERLIAKYNNSNISTEKSIFFLAISDLLYYSIQQQNELLARRLVTFLTETFMNFRDGKESQVVKYPAEYYDTIFEANELLCLRRKKTISYYNNSTLVNLYIDGYQKTSISEETYSAIWLCLRQALNYERDDIIVSHWKNAHQHFNFSLSRIHEIRDGKFLIINKDEVENRNNERLRFLEFHYALGGLLMYLKKYNLLKRLMRFTNQDPPKYMLVPETMGEVIKRYMQTQEDVYNPFHFESRYNFPEIEGVNKGGVIRMWIRKYIALLLLRQYTLHDYNYGRSSLDLPNLPTSLSELNQWKNELGFLKKYVEKFLNNKIVLDEVGFSGLTKKWFSDNQKQEPSELIDELIDRTVKAYEETKKSQPVSESKEAEFKKQTKDIVLSATSLYSEIENSGKIKEKYKSFYLTGTYQLMDKGGFADNQDISYLGSDSIVAQGVASSFLYNLSSTFSYFVAKRYLLIPEDIFPSIEKMNFDLSKIVIISFGIHLQHYLETLSVIELTKQGDSYYYKNIKIINFNSNVSEIMRNSFFIINKEDLPAIEYNIIQKNEIKKYKLEELDEKTHLAASIVNLNKEPELRKDIAKNVEEKDLTKSVLACIAINAEVRWKNISKGYQLKVFYQFSDRGNPNSLEDVTQLK